MHHQLPELPILQIDTQHPWLRDETRHAAQTTAQTLVETLMRYGIALIRPDRNTSDINRRFLKVLENFYRLPRETRMRYIVEHHGVKYETGYMPRNAEIAEKTDEYDAYIRTLKPENIPLASSGRNVIERWMHPTGARSQASSFAELNLPAVLVREIPAFNMTIDEWGGLVLPIAFTVAEYLSIGLRLPMKTFSDRLHDGPHLLAPTGVNLLYEFFMDQTGQDADAAQARYDAYADGHYQLPHARRAFFAWLQDTTYLLDAFHNDLNFFTLHGRSNAPALVVYDAQGNRFSSAAIPEGCLLIQSGRQLRYLTGGMIPAMYHEVTTMPGMIPFAAECMERGVAPVRVGCPLFLHVNSDVPLEPLMGDRAAYPKILAGTFVKNILQRIYGAG